jgi:DNA transposition AAA+ family ATPase
MMAMIEKEVVKKDLTKERTLLHKLVKEEGTKVGDVAQAVGKSHSTISLYLKGTYPANEDFETSIRNYLISIGKWQEEEIAEAHPEGGWLTNVRNLNVIQTKDRERVWGVCRACLNNNEFGMITGAPGLGKTYSLEAYQGIVTTKTAIITLDKTTSVKSLLVDTADALDLQTKGTSATLLRRIVKHLKKKEMLLIYDEADLPKLPMAFEVYETIRTIYDKTKVGIVLCGNDVLAERILVVAEDRPEMARLRDRIGYYTKLSGLSYDEAERFITRLNATLGAKKMLMEIGRKRGIRQLVKAIGRLLDVTQGELITETLVEELGAIVLSFKA